MPSSWCRAASSSAPPGTASSAACGACTVRGGGDEFGPDHVHRVTNEGPDPAVSLHVYAPRLTTQRDYVAHDGILQLLRTRAAGADW